MRANYDLRYKKSDIAEMHDKFQSDWQKNAISFAFGAYGWGGKMIAFSCGHFEQRTVMLDSLYVLPKFQNKKLGVRLLQHVETAAALQAGTINLTSLPRAEQFYVRNGYNPVMGACGYTNNYTKAIRKPVYSVQPIFSGGNKAVQKACTELNENAILQIKHNHLPMYVYTDESGLITGHIAALPDGHANAATNDTVRNRLASVLNGYLSRAHGGR